MKVLEALSFLTRLPMRAGWVTHGRPSPDLLAYFPFAGLLIGGLQACFYLGLVQIFSADLALLLTMCLGLFVSGAFHEDGLADVADSLGGFTQERRLEILKDSRLGTFGTTALVFFFIIKWQCLSGLSSHGPGSIASLLVILGAWSRLAPIILLRLLPYVGSALGQTFSATPWPLIAGLVVFFFALGAMALGPVMFLLLAAAVALLAGLGVAFRRLYGGVTGDAMGAGICLLELASLLILSAGRA